MKKKKDTYAEWCYAQPKKVPRFDTGDHIIHLIGAIMFIYLICIIFLYY
jgi:hypothetical protein